MSGADPRPHRSDRAPGRARPWLVAAIVVVVVGAFVAAIGMQRLTAGPDRDGAATRPGTDAYRGLGTWIDVYDFVPARQAAGGAPPVSPQDLRTAAAAGIGTIYLQAADQSAPGVVDAALLGAFLRAAHDAGLQVVGWYLPTFEDPAADLGRLQAILDFSHEGQRFDGVAVDIEDVRGVPDHQERTERLLRLSAALERHADGRPLGAIVPAPVLLEDVNPQLWPDFPWADLAPHYGAWLVMNYWTGRSESSGWRDAYRYSVENLERVRTHLGDERAPVHLVGGVADEASEADYAGFAAALADGAAGGASLYDFRTTSVAGLLRLQRLAADDVWARPAPAGAPEQRRTAATAPSPVP